VFSTCCRKVHTKRLCMSLHHQYNSITCISWKSSAPVEHTIGWYRSKVTLDHLNHERESDSRGRCHNECDHRPEIRYCKISKEMSSLYFGLDVFCQFKARAPEFNAVLSVECHSCWWVEAACQILRLEPQIGRIQQATKDNDDISLLISKYLISAIGQCVQFQYFACLLTRLLFFRHAEIHCRSEKSITLF
jgi:hypothetical protein